MNKLIIGLLFSTTILFAQTQKLIVDALHFETNDSKGLSIFKGKVKLLMNKDKLNSDKLEIYTKRNKKGREPLKYIATGNVHLNIFSKGKNYKGKGDKIIYIPKEKEYLIIGNGYLKELVEDREIFGDKIIINQIKGTAKVTGSEKKPVRFIINMDKGDK